MDPGELGWLTVAILGLCISSSLPSYLSLLWGMTENSSHQDAGEDKSRDQGSPGCKVQPSVRELWRREAEGLVLKVLGYAPCGQSHNSF